MPQDQNRKIKEIGRVISFYSGVAKLKGLPHVFIHEVLADEAGREVAIVIGFDNNFVEALFFDEKFDLDQAVFRTWRSFSIQVSKDIIGRVINGLGQSRDGLANISGDIQPVFKEAPQIIDRQPISSSLFTGIKIIDTTLPLGRGQRELIIGDRKLGKSTIAIDTVLNQKDVQPTVYCIYVISGQKEQKLRELVSILEKQNAFIYTVVVAATAGDSFAAQYLAPFVGCAIGEYFRDAGQDALVIYDSLSEHARAYRDISLLLERAPGREAYPGDIFSLHGKLLERAAKLSAKLGGGSLTALPITETQEGDITSFIPTNLISITDGQIYLDRGLFQKGFLPAVNVGLSVSRVGSSAQSDVFQKVVKGIRLTLAQHKELQKLSQLETVVSNEAQKRIQRGDLILELLKQDKHTKVSMPEQVILFYIANQGFFDDIQKDKWNSFVKLLLESMSNLYFSIFKKINKGEFDDKIKEEISEIVINFKKEFLSN